MHHYFGWGSISILAHVAKLFEYERLVSADGANVYATDQNLLRHLNLPIGLLHGNRNQVFDPESSRRSFERINRIHWGGCQLLDVEGDYAHFDCLAGDNADREVFPAISGFFSNYTRG